ncbi:hypothetical protein DSO57_1000582 [Entomophthora muscae]|nr:hypothetical protein DSO57_1000582 [Entomophthora muscae]
MMMGLLGTTISMFLFGISKGLSWALVTRFLAGSLNGNVGVLRTIVGEITDHTNRADAFSYVALTFGIGLIVGPVLGGFLTNPAVKFPWLFGNMHFFKEYPYFLPCGVSSLLCAIGFVLTYFFIEETLGHEQPKLEISEREVTAPLLQTSSLRPLPTSYNLTQQVKDPQPANLESGKPLEDSSGPHGKISFGTWLIILGYMGFSLVLVMSDELFPFWASTATTGGGLGYQSEDIGTLNSMMGIVLILVQLTLFSPLQRQYGTLALFRWASVLYIPPFCSPSFGQSIS